MVLTFFTCIKGRQHRNALQALFPPLSKMIFLMKNKPDVSYELIWRHFSKIILTFAQLNGRKVIFIIKKCGRFFECF